MALNQPDEIRQLVADLRSPHWQVCISALSSLAIIANGTVEQQQAIINGGAIPHLLRLLSIPKQSIYEQASLALNNLARGIIEQIRILAPEPELLLQSPNLFDCEQLVNTLTEIASETKEQRQTIINEGAVPYFVKLLQSRENKLIIAAVRVIRKLAYDQQQVLIGEGVIPCFVQLLQSPSYDIKKEILEILLGIASGPNEQKEQLIDDSVMRRFLELLQSSENNLIEQLTVRVIHELTNGKNEVKQVLIDKGVIRRLIELLPSTPDLTTQRILEILIEIAIENKHAVIIGDAVTHYVTLLEPSDKELIKLTVKLIRELANGTNPVKQVLIDKGLTKRLIEILPSTPNSTKQMILEILIKIAKGKRNQKQKLIDEGLIPCFVGSLQSPSIQDSTLQRVLEYLIDFAEETSEQANLVMQAGVIKRFMDLLDSPTKAIAENAARALSNLCGKKEQRDQVIEAGIIPCFKNLLYSRNEILVEQAAKGLSNIMGGTERQAKQVIQAGVIPRFIELLYFPNKVIVEEAACGLCNILAGTERQAEQVIQAGVIPRFIKLLYSPHKAHIGQAASGLSLILVVGTEEQIDQVIQAGVIPRFMDLLGSHNNYIAENTARCLNNILLGTPEQIETVLQAGIIPRLSYLLETKHNFIVDPGSDERKNLVIRALRRSTSFLTLKHPDICEQLCRLIANIAAGNTEQKQIIIDENLLLPLKNLLKPSSSVICEQAARALANIAAGTIQQKQKIIDEKLLMPLKNLLQPSSPVICKQAARTFANIADGSFQQRDRVIETGVIPRFIHCLESHNAAVAEEAVRALANIADGTIKQREAVFEITRPLLMVFSESPHLAVRKQAIRLLSGSNHDQTVARLEVELTDFGGKVKYPPFESILQFVKIMQQRKARGTIEPEMPSIEDFDEGSDNLIKLCSLRKIMDIKLMKLEDQWFLWRSRKKIMTNFPSMLPIIIDLPIMWKTRDKFCELYGMLVDWPLLQVDAAMEILDGKCTDTWIRDAAVERIDKALDNDQLQLYLLPLVQALRYEPFANSGLSRMLVKRGLLNYKIGHTLFWLLRAEMNYFELSQNVVKVPKFYARFAICLEMYLRANAVHLESIVKQVELVNILTSLSLLVKTVGAKEFATKKFQQELETNKESLQNMTSPLNPTEILGELLIEKCSVLGSAKQPLKLTWKNSEPLAKLTSDLHQILFKNGDDLRQDMLTLQVMRIMDAKWKIYNLDYNLTLYEVLPMGRNIGMIHVVQNCQTLFQIQVSANQVGSTFSMDNTLLNKHLYQCSTDSKQYMECVDRFTSSLAGYCIATYVLGIKDRHQDNIMLGKDGRLFHIDFGHFLGHTKKKLGINRERTEFILTEHFLNIISRGKNNFKDTYEYKSFREHCVRGFLVLYHNARFFIVLFRMMKCMGLPELSKQSHIDFIYQSLMYDKTTEEARNNFLQIFDEVVKSDWSTSVNWFFHSVKHL